MIYFILVFFSCSWSLGSSPFFLSLSLSCFNLFFSGLESSSRFFHFLFLLHLFRYLFLAAVHFSFSGELFWHVFVLGLPTFPFFRYPFVLIHQLHSYFSNFGLIVFLPVNNPEHLVSRCHHTPHHIHCVPSDFHVTGFWHVPQGSFFPVSFLLSFLFPFSFSSVSTSSSSKTLSFSPSNSSISTVSFLSSSSSSSETIHVWNLSLSIPSILILF